jgi:hypothetical protein
MFLCANRVASRGVRRHVTQSQPDFTSAKTTADVSALPSSLRRLQTSAMSKQRSTAEPHGLRGVYFEY